MHQAYLKHANSIVLGLAIVSGFLTGCGAPDRSNWIPADDRYDVRILRDTWGVAHVFGKTDADAAYGMAFAHSEDDWTNIQDAVLVGQGRIGEVHGKDFAKFDYILQLFKVRRFVEERYETVLSDDTRAVLEAYADGINHYAAQFPDKMPELTRPATGKDIVAGFTLKAPFFYELHVVLEDLMGPDKPAEAVTHKEASLIPTENPYTRGLPIGSNAYAVSPKNSADGHTRLAVNSHQPWDGQVAWYEMHVHSEEGWNMAGGTFPGGPMIFSGHDEFKGWCHTVNRPDLVDVYELTMNPDNPDQYKLDGEWVDLEKDTARLKVKILGPITWTVKREVLWSRHGPVIRADHGVYALRFAGYGELGMVEQWFRMNKAKSFEEFKDALSMQGLPSFNCVYADAEGNILYLYNGQFPLRKEGYDWRAFLPGDDSSLIYEERLPFDRVPMIENPESGVLFSCNQTPYDVTVGDDRLKPEDFPVWQGIETGQTNRGLRALETYGGDDSITREEFYTYKFDKQYSPKYTVAKMRDTILATDLPDVPLLKEARAVLESWDLKMNKENTAAALGLLACRPNFGYERALNMDTRDMSSLSPVERLRYAAEHLQKHFGTLTPQWGEVMRLRRGEHDLPLGGAPEVSRVVWGPMQPDGRFAAAYGDGVIMMVDWDPEGNLTAETIHNYGAATVDEASPHYDDQAPLFANEEWRPVLLSEASIRENLSREYRPRNITGPWYADE
jgi:penicillin amidase/acyl-homoserine-lactone acylase